jgi:feruloyl esterase
MAFKSVLSRSVAAVAGSFLGCGALGAANAADASCEGLKATALPHAEVTSATLVQPSGAGPTATPSPYCRVAVTSRPTADSDIHIEVWIPAGDAWNGRYLHMGNGGFSGTISAPQLAEGVRRGFATANTDNGHQAPGAVGTWAYGHPEKLKDYGYRSLKETTDISKALVRAYKGAAPRYSYFNGCSGGGRDALMQAQRFPTDFDGIVAGAPANYMTRLIAAGAWSQQSVAGLGIGAPQLAALTKAALAQCGGTEGYINDPVSCRFDPAAAQCKSGESGECLTPAQIAAIRKVYAGPKDPKTGRSIFPGYSFGQAAGWTPWIVGADGAPSLLQQFSQGLYGGMMRGEPGFDILKIDVGKENAAAEAQLAPYINAANPDLGGLKRRGTKLIQYHGADDPAIPLQSSLNYFQAVQSRMGDTGDFYRLFVVPGMLHCGGGAGPAAVDWLAPLQDWVEKGVAPDRIVGHFLPAGAAGFGPPAPPAPDAASRPICRFPAVAKYSGQGDPKQAASYACVSARLAKR